jgi:hypothetical protein
MAGGGSASPCSISGSSDFLKSASAAGKFRNQWSDAMQTKVVRYLFASLSDFRLTRNLPKNQREILPFAILPTTTAFLAYELHFTGVTDSNLLEHPDWAADVDESPGEIHVSRALISETRNPAKRPMALKARRSLSFDSASSDAPVRVSGCLAAWR